MWGSGMFLSAMQNASYAMLWSTKQLLSFYCKKLLVPPPGSSDWSIVLERYINKHDERVKQEILSNAAFMTLQKHFLLLSILKTVWAAKYFVETDAIFHDSFINKAQKTVYLKHNFFWQKF